jgi:hypothetical protein
MSFDVEYPLGDLVFHLRTNHEFFIRRKDQWFGKLRPLGSLRGRRILIELLIESRSSRRYKQLFRLWNILDGKGFYISKGWAKVDKDKLLWKEETSSFPSLALMDFSKASSLFLIPQDRFNVDEEILIPQRLLMGVPLRSLGRVYLHASCVAKGQEGILIPGPRGCGKTVFLFYLVLKKGFEFISNDKVLLGDERNHINAVGILSDIRFRRDVLSFFPELGHGWGSIDPLKFFKGKLRKRVRVSQIIIPRKALGGDLKVPLHRVLVDLLENAGSIPIRELFQMDMDIFSRLISSCPIQVIPWRRGDLPDLSCL